MIALVLMRIWSQNFCLGAGSAIFMPNGKKCQFSGDEKWNFQHRNKKIETPLIYQSSLTFTSCFKWIFQQFSVLAFVESSLVQRQYLHRWTGTTKDAKVPLALLWPFGTCMACLLINGVHRAAEVEDQKEANTGWLVCNSTIRQKASCTVFHLLSTACMGWVACGGQMLPMVGKCGHS